jgi:ABC-type transport system involved in multi-copper enzyme maturation permease subunit
MLSKTFALLVRALRVDARQIRVHLLRLAMVLVVFPFSLFFVQLKSLLLGAPGLDFFESITWTTFVFSTLAGATFFATAITEEKEEQTLGLLALANIQPLALILGKFLPRLISALLILSVVFPFTLLSITLGGVTWNQVWAAYWTLLSHLVLIGSLGLICSVVCRKSSSACALTVCLTILFLAGPPLLGALCGALAQQGVAAGAARAGDALAEGLAAAAAAPRIARILQTGFDEPPFGRQVWADLAGGGALFLLSWLLFRPFNKDHESTTERVSLLQRGLVTRRGSRRAWRWAVVWKDFHFLSGGPLMWGAKALAFAPLGLFAGLAANNWQLDARLLRETGVMLMAIMLWGAIPLELTVVAARLFRGEIKDRTWPGLVSLPVSIAELAYAKAAGGVLGLVPAIAYFGLGAALAPDWLAEKVLDPTGEGGAILASHIAAAVWLLVFLHLTALYSILINAWAGVFLALLTLFVGTCFTYPLLAIPAMIVMVAAEAGGALLGLALSAVIFAGIAGLICFALQLLIAQRLRVAARE